MIYSHTFFNNWENCNHKAARMYILKDLPREPATQAMTWGKDVHRAFEQRINNRRPFNTEMASYEKFIPVAPYRLRAELKLGVDDNGKPCDFFADNVRVRGVIDLEITAVEKPTMAIIWDWKTGKLREDAEELELHAMMLNAKHPYESVYGQYVWLQDGKLGKRHDLSQTAWKWEQTRERIDEIEHAIKMQSFPKNQNPLCDYCPVKDCEYNGRGRMR